MTNFKRDNHVDKAARDFAETILIFLTPIYNQTDTYEWRCFADALDIAEGWLDTYYPITESHAVLPHPTLLTKIIRTAQEFYNAVSRLTPANKEQAAYYEIMLESLSSWVTADMSLFSDLNLSWLKKLG